MSNKKTEHIIEFTITILLILTIILLIQNTQAQTNQELLQSTTEIFGNQTPGTNESDLKLARTITVSNYTTPNNMGTITEIKIYLTTIYPGEINAVIFENNEANLPLDGTPIAESTPITVTNQSLTAEWYNFTINCPLAQNKSYWIGYYSTNQTKYAYTPDNNFLTITSQQKDPDIQWLPVAWSYIGKSTMSLYATYIPAEPLPPPTPTPQQTPTPIPTIPPTAKPTQTPKPTATMTPTPNPTTVATPSPTPTLTPTATPTPTLTPSGIQEGQQTSVLQDSFFLLFIISGETAIVMKNKEEKNNKNSSDL